MMGWIQKKLCSRNAWGLLFLLAAACGSGKSDVVAGPDGSWSTDIVVAGPDGSCSTDIVGRQTLRGSYTVSFEHWLFRPCGSETVIWVDPDSLSQATGAEKMAQAQQVVSAEHDGGTSPFGGSAPVTIFMEIVADVSPLGVYGHLGESGQELQVIEVLSASASSPSDCPKVETTVSISRRPDCQK
jgi:hypothetical protein